MLMIFVIALGAFLLIGIAAVAIAWPLVQERNGMPEYAIGGATATVEDPLVELTARRDSVYQALRELRFDHQVGKVSEADYKVFDTQLKGQAVTVLKEIDGLKKAEADPNLDTQIEAEIAALRSNVQAPLGVSAAETGPVAPVNFCPKCGAKVKPGDRFCGKCGTVLG
jgi:hypothetical protein